MPTDEGRREVARRLREPFDVIGQGRYVALNGTLFGMQLLAGDEGTLRAGIACLADLIEPTDGFDLDTVQRVCFECMEGCDEPEWTLYTTIHDAIARYKRGESGPTYDRDALLRLADELEAGARVARARRWNEPANAAMAIALADEYEANARRIREALGEGA